MFEARDCRIAGARQGISGRLGLLVLLFFVLSCEGDAGFGPNPDSDPELIIFVEIMNDHRESVGCARLTWNRDVAEVAQAHSEDMVERDFFDHTNPDGKSPFDRLRDAGIAYSGAAENIAWGYPSAEAVLDGWLNSSGHRSNIENCSLTEHGVGLYQSHWTHLFIRP
jgi:uncharacterized protein YkwD